MVAFDELLSRLPEAAIDTAALDSIEGWLSEPAAKLTTSLVHLQRCRSTVTGVLELGVHRGRYLALLAAAHAGTPLPLVGVDALLDSEGTRLPPEHREGAIAIVHRNVRAVAGASAAVRLFGSYTRDLDLDVVRARCPDGFTFISVDAGHTAPDVAVDLDIAESLAGPWAVIAIDDAFNPRTPGVPEALARHLGREAGVELRPFATAGNKLFAAVSEEARQLYLAFCHWLMDTRTDVPFIAASARARTEDHSQRYVPEFFGYELATFLYAEG